MVAGSILPVAIQNRKLYFLFGKENALEDSNKGWSDFGGGVESGESPYDTALREGGEELTGFLGDNKDIQNLLKKSGKIYSLEHNGYHVHMFLMEYDDNLPKYYNNNHSFLWKRMDKHLLNKTKLFEKIEIGWFSAEQMKLRRNEFRNFYREIVDKIINEMPYIFTIMSKNKKRLTRRRNKNIRSHNRSYKRKIGK
jgi:8-oxo-dGTP pyrophosphatase MutT (NUDIX family)